MAWPARRGNRLITGAVAGAAMWGAPRAARADGPLEWGRFALSPGIAFEVAFGRTYEAGVVFDVRGTWRTSAPASGCGDERGIGAGLYAQAAWFHRTGWRFGGGVHGGGDLVAGIYGIDAELGYSYVIGSRLAPSSHVLHLGALQNLPISTAPIALQLPLALQIVFSDPGARPLVAGAGLRAPPLFGMVGRCSVQIGRPLRAGDGQILGAARVTTERRIPSCGAFTCPEIAAGWLDDARAECASVPAFLALARDLSLVGAPPSLVTRALAAAEDEVRHTRICAELAAHHGGLDHELTAPPVPPPTDVSREAALERLAREAWLDGVLGEGAAATGADRAHSMVRDPDARRALAVIARDERRHAELAWSILAWSMAVGGDRVRHVVGGLVDDAGGQPASSHGGDTTDRALLRAHGRITTGELCRAWVETRERAGRRVRPMLA